MNFKFSIPNYFIEIARNQYDIRRTYTQICNVNQISAAESDSVLKVKNVVQMVNISTI